MKKGEDTDLPSVSSDRRIWKKRTPADGSSGLVLRVFGILYDAGRPLSRDELVARLDTQLDVHERAYLEAWHLRCTRKPKLHAANAKYSMKLRPIHAWFTTVFLKRLYQGHSLIRDADGRYAPGPTPPRVLTIDGRLLDFTPAVRQQLAHADHEAGRIHLALLEWSKQIDHADFATIEARAQLLMLIVRRLILGTPPNMPLDERQVIPRLAHLFRLVDSPAVQRVLLERVLHDLLAILVSPTGETPSNLAQDAAVSRTVEVK